LVSRRVATINRIGAFLIEQGFGDRVARALR
jgi:hypothetical protein